MPPHAGADSPPAHLGDIMVTREAPATGLAADRQRSTRMATTVLTIIGTLGIVALEYTGFLVGQPMRVHAVFMAVPAVTLMAHVLVRSGYTLPAGVAAIAAAAANAVIMAWWAPELTPVASTYLMLVAVLILGGLVMPFEVAAGLSVVNMMLTVTLPTFLPLANADAVRVPYMFLFLNAAFLLFTGVLRIRDLDHLQDSRKQAMAIQHRLRSMEESAHRLEQAHRARMLAMEDQARETRQMLNAASHELRTPITPLLVQMAAFRLRYGAEFTAEQSKAVGLLERNLKRMASLVDDLLDVARMENGRLNMDIGPCDVNAALEEARAAFEDQAAARGIRIHVHAKAPRIEADAGRVNQVIYNLLGNALKFSPEQGTVHIEANAEDNGVRVAVRDEGPGLDEKQRKRLFQAFSQVHEPTQQIKGTGLGLYISQGIVNQHGGRIRVQSGGSGKGSTFSFWLPVRPPADLPRTALPPQAPPGDLLDGAASPGEIAELHAPTPSS